MPHSRDQHLRASDSFDESTPPPPFRTDGSNAFAHYSIAERVPRIIQETLDRNPDFTGEMRRELHQLKEDIQQDRLLRSVSPPAPDFDLWRAEFAKHEGQTWLDTEWFFAEMLAYRRMLEACRYWSTLQDPFAPFKHEDLATEEIWKTLEAVLETDGALDVRLATHFIFSLWGNRIDLSIKESAAMGTAARDEHLIVSDIPAAVSHLLSNRPGDIHFFADNAGTELALDLALADMLLTQRTAGRVILHVKMQPVLVSDAIVGDVHTLLKAMAKRAGRTRQLSDRLAESLTTGGLSLVPDFFWGTARRLPELPERLALPLSDAALVIAKGDLNYRRITNDAVWPPEARFADAVGDFPAPLLALRTLKCDALVGVDAATRRHLDEEGEPNWRTSGAYGVAQLALP